MSAHGMGAKQHDDRVFRKSQNPCLTDDSQGFWNLWAPVLPVWCGGRSLSGPGDAPPSPPPHTLPAGPSAMTVGCRPRCSVVLYRHTFIMAAVSFSFKPQRKNKRKAAGFGAGSVPHDAKGMVLSSQAKRIRPELQHVFGNPEAERCA